MRGWIAFGTAIVQFTVYLLCRLATNLAFAHRGLGKIDVLAAAVYGILMGSLPVRNLILKIDTAIAKRKKPEAR